MLQYLTVQQVAKIYQLSTSTLYNLVSLKRIPFVKAGGALRFDPTELEIWLKRSQLALSNSEDMTCLPK